MKKSTTFTSIVQTLLTEEDVASILKETEYTDTARKFTAHQLYCSLCMPLSDNGRAIDQASARRKAAGFNRFVGLTPQKLGPFS